MDAESQPFAAKFPQEGMGTPKGGESRVMGGRNRRLESGQGMVEYALILVLVSVVVIVILLTMGNQILNVFSNVVAALGA